MARYLRDPSFVLATLVAVVLLALLLVPFDAWIGFFAHPTHLARLGAVPATTTRGVAILTMVLPWAALAWLATAFALQNIESTTPLRTRPLGMRDGALLAGFIVVGLVLRWLRLDESLWYDEIAAMLSFSIHGTGPSLGNYYALSNHALHSALVALSIDVAGAVNEPIVRTPAFVFGLASIPAIYVLGRAIGGRRVGLMSAALLTMMPVAIIESTEARGYSMMLFFAIIASWLALGMQRRGANLHVLGYAVCITLGIWTHLVFVCVPIGHAIAAASWRRRRKASLRLLFGIALGAVTTLLVLSPLLPDLLSMRGEFQATDGNEPTLFGIEGAHAVLQLGGSWTWWASVPGGVLAIYGAVVMCTGHRGRVALAVLALGGVVAAVLVGLADSWLYARFVVFMLAPASVAMAIGLRAMRPRPAMVAAIVVVGVWTIGLAMRGPKQPIYQGVQAAASLSADGRVLSIGLVDDVAAYYARPFDLEMNSTGLLGAELGDLAEAPDVALILYPDLVPNDVYKRLAEAGFVEVARFTGWLDWGHGDVAVLERIQQ